MPPGVQILSFSCSFRQKNCKIIVSTPILRGKILDPLLLTLYISTLVSETVTLDDIDLEATSETDLSAWSEVSGVLLRDLLFVDALLLHLLMIDRLVTDEWEVFRLGLFPLSLFALNFSFSLDKSSLVSPECDVFFHLSQQRCPEWKLFLYFHLSLLVSGVLTCQYQSHQPWWAMNAFS